MMRWTIRAVASPGWPALSKNLTVSLFEFRFVHRRCEVRWIVYPDQRQSVWRRIRATLAPIRCLEDQPDVCRVHAAPAHLDQRPYDATDHVPQEGVRGNLETDQVAILPPRCPLNPPDGRPI